MPFITICIGYVFVHYKYFMSQDLKITQHYFFCNEAFLQSLIAYLRA